MAGNLFLLAGAGALGTLSRFALSGLVLRHAGAGFPWGTLAVNVLGCFLAGLVWSLAESRGVATDARAVLLIGFMGGFTTFSAFGIETGLLLQQGHWVHAGGNVIAQNVGGLTAVLAGLFAGRLL